MAGASDTAASGAATAVAEAVLTRRSVRAFIERPVPLETLQRVLEQARWAPSGCNFQPWEAVVLTGAALRALQDRLLASAPDTPQEYDFFAPSRIEKYHARRQAFGASLYDALGIDRDDAEARAAFNRRNLLSFGAPVVMLCHFPKAMEAAQWVDVGIWLQTIMLLLRGEGLDSCSQEFLGLYGRTIKAHLGLPDDVLLFGGLGIGWRDASAPVNGWTRERVPLAGQVMFQGFEQGGGGSR